MQKITAGGSNDRTATRRRSHLPYERRLCSLLGARIEDPNRPAAAETAPLPEIGHVDPSAGMNGDVERLGELQALVVLVEERPVVGDRRARVVERERMQGVRPFEEQMSRRPFNGPGSVYCNSRWRWCR